MVIMAPSDEAEARKMLTTGFLHDGPVAIRYPRGSGDGAAVGSDLTVVDFGKAQIVREGEKTAILVFGTLLNNAKSVAESLNATLVNMRFVKPLDTETVLSIAKTHDRIVTIEDNAIAGGAGSAITEYLNQAGLSTKVLQLGYPDTFVEQGSQEELNSLWGLDSKGIKKAIEIHFNEELLI